MKALVSGKFANSPALTHSTGCAVYGPPSALLTPPSLSWSAPIREGTGQTPVGRFRPRFGLRLLTGLARYVLMGP